MFNNTTHNHFLPISSTLSIEAASGLGRPSHAHLSSAASSTPDATFQSHAASALRTRKSTKNKSGKQLSRSLSTPQLRDGAMSDSDSDKKRNKLGYQRISIACVDQQAAMEGRPETSATLLPGSGPSSIISVSPPNIGMDRPLASAHDFPAFSAVPSNAPSHYEGLPLEPGSALLGHGAQQTPQRFIPTESDPRLGGFIQPNHTYRAETDTRSWSASAALETSGGRMLARRAEGSSQMYSRYTNSPSARADFAPYPTTEPTQMQKAFHSAPGLDYPPKRNNAMGALPARAIPLLRPNRPATPKPPPATIPTTLPSRPAHSRPHYAALPPIRAGRPKRSHPHARRERAALGSCGRGRGRSPGV
ncbi:hypothetical protein LTR91_011988 [Friedmanniomyces endolithicus]|uniref:Uncharacterized protein n=1 Tax=Friedmanniomyces endolithicus TaxID=329885 RepID=A0AAN6KGF4_9PEZI|nr:hypothetical protein LTR57_014188 [Friedmanniomyces endolithicus]KAK0972259.1 hypothetical protein LTS01_014972 [Friedmanniomyces endolithicus]KAK0981132.1 hypothetical protein LTR91_011988 [Friedmanniomyces endolithicus]KAK1035155.1 hypothetical protein LTS16_014859 [Friedmanniomyces endolithicus]